MSKLIVIGNAGAGTNQALLRAFKNAEVAFVNAAEAMNEFGEAARLIHDNDSFHPIKLRCSVELPIENYLDPIPTKQKHPPRSFKNSGKGGKRKQW